MNNIPTLPHFVITSLPLNEAELQQWGKALAGHLQTADIVLLQGDLGAGKTTLARALVQGLCGATTIVPSPTFTLVQTYQSSRGMVFHFDLYRLPANQPQQIYELGWDDALLDGISLVEWPERLGVLAPKHALMLDLTPTTCGQYRTITASGNLNWQAKVPKF
jgi:tRNA threonylcarbamoyladenosine biosynthesis protein TsaE